MPLSTKLGMLFPLVGIPLYLRMWKGKQNNQTQ